MASIPDGALAAPVTKAARVESLDILRGVAVFGILMMNITAFGLLGQAYDNPLVDGGAEGLNLTVYKIINVGFEGTMRGIFSLLFGAGIVLLTERMEQAGAGIMAAEIHFRRMGWMLLAGFIHWALLLWYGEILFAYAMCGMLIFTLRKLPAKLQFAIAAVLLAGSVMMSNIRSQDMADVHAAASVATAAQASGAVLTAEQEAAIAGWAEVQSHFAPTPEGAAEQRAIHAGSWWSAVKNQFAFSYQFQWTDSPRWLLTDMIPFMLIGMALLQLGVLGAQLPARTYGLMLLGGYAVGLTLGFRELNLILASNFEPLGFAAAGETYQFSRLAMVIGHLGLLLLIIRSGAVGWLQRALGAVGQMALTNYLMQTLICTALFYGFGFGLFGQFERYQLYGVVAAIWLVELVWSPLWLARFRFGPFEWLWRSLTYWQRQPMRI
jgi:uncharacterized protein